MDPRSLLATLVTTVTAAAALSAVGVATMVVSATPADASGPAGPTEAADAAGPAGAAEAAEAAARALPDGLARTPPMGFNNWNSTHCRAEFDEEMIKGIADLFVSSGLKDAGYEYVNIDDCWALPERGPGGELVPDPKRFPNGIKALADYVHGKGLKFGIYTSAGTKTCNSAGFPGGLGHEEQDAALFASWGVDYLKYDNCNNQGVDARLRYTRMRDALKATGRPIVFSICEWGENEPWLWAADVGHLWRTTGDISDSWTSMLSILKRNLPLAPYAGPGHWNDPDMLEVGNGGMTGTEYRTHFGMWAIMAAPLLIGSDLRSATPETMEILGNREVIAIDQDPLGVQGTALTSAGGRWVVVKPLANGDRAVALFNETDTPQPIATTAAAIGLPEAPAYRLRDLWEHTDRHTAGAISATVPAHGTTLLRVSADPDAVTHPPAVGLGLTAAGPYPGGPALTGPDGWRIEPATPPATPSLPGRSRLETAWSVEVAAAAAPGTYELTATLTWRPPPRASGPGEVTQRLGLRLAVPEPPPRGTVQAGDVPWLAASNGAATVRLLATDGGDGDTSDHGHWAGTELACDG